VPQSLFQSELFQDAPAIADRLTLPPREGHFDELRDGVGPAQGAMRESWRRFFELLGADGFGDLDRRLEVVARQVQENGMTYTVYADEGPPRPWSLDLLPFIVEDAEWREIEAGVAQRAALLEAIVGDAYGPQTLISEGLIPSALVCGHPGYLREMHGVAVPGDLRLHIVAFDLGRDPKGRWSVVSQRTQAPSGLGYALENRLTISRLFPEAFGDLRVQHLAGSYRRLLDMLEALVLREADTMFDQPAPRDFTASAHGQLAEWNRDGRERVPRIVLLTPGPYNETYFEHAYLARYLGLPLVEGSDLTVRDERVYLKTMRGLERVHGILRRLDDDFCDPVELRSESSIGVPGLLQAIRAKHVLVANALGCGFLESPALNGFLPAIAQRLVGQDLLLPSLSSWWCGEAAAREAVTPDLANRVVKPTYPSSTGRPSFEPLIGAAATASQLETWRKRIEGDPDAYTVQSHLPLSQAPTWTGGRIVPRAAMLRVFAIAEAPGTDDGGDGHATKRWRVFPGALARIANRDRQIVSMQRGGSSLDTWVRTSGPIDDFSMLPAKLQPDELIAARTTRARPVSSRAAENLFWMGRYTERAEYDVRLTRLVLNRLPADDSLPPLFFDAVRELCISAGLVERAVPSPRMAPRVFERALIAGLPPGEDNRGVGFALQALARAAGQIRDRLSPEHWRLVSSTIEEYSARLASHNADEKRKGSTAREALEHVGTQLYAITGAQTDRMTRDDGWRLLTIGRQIERLMAMSNALTIMLERDVLQSERERAFALVLGLFDSTITYRSLYQRRQELAALLDLLVFDDDNPRALVTMVEVLRSEVTRLPDTGAGPAATLLADFPADGLDVTLGELVERDDEGRLGAALALTGRLEDLARQLSSDIALRYFSIVGDLWRTTAR
jgi:uncharacterized circularly permuted ATP-grasp superfamily protein/uncharacterized alpha-E superfamily protein